MGWTRDLTLGSNPKDSGPLCLAAKPRGTVFPSPRCVPRRQAPGRSVRRPGWAPEPSTGALAPAPEAPDDDWEVGSLCPGPRRPEGHRDRRHPPLALLVGGASAGAPRGAQSRPRGSPGAFRLSGTGQGPERVWATAIPTGGSPSRGRRAGRARCARRGSEGAETPHPPGKRPEPVGHRCVPSAPRPPVCRARPAVWGTCRPAGTGTPAASTWEGGLPWRRRAPQGPFLGPAYATCPPPAARRRLKLILSEQPQGSVGSSHLFMLLFIFISQDTNSSREGPGTKTVQEVTEGQGRGGPRSRLPGSGVWGLPVTQLRHPQRRTDT